jgi:DNA-binding transcriptional MerR regulator
MAWSIAEVARMSGVTSRTQQILLLRELGVGLGDIADAIGSGPDTVTALRRHHVRLLAESKRLARLAGTVSRTITELEQLEGDGTMSAPQINRPENLFEGLNPADYDDEARERWPAQYEQAQQVVQGLSPERLTDEQKELTAQMIRMAELMTAGKPAADPEVQAEVDQHYRWVARYWTPTAQAYRNLGQMYVSDERFRANYEAITAGLAAYQRDAMAVYTDERLS